MTKIKAKQNKFMRAAICTAVFCMLIQAPVFCDQANDDTSKAFNLMTVVDNFLNLDSDNKSAYESLDEKAKQRREYIETTRRFNQGNVSVAYNDYLKIITELDNDISLLVSAKSMYEIGFFTLGDVAISKIKNRNYFAGQIENLKKTYKENHALDKGEEIYLAKAYASIYFDNTPEETAFDLSKKSGLMEKSGYANFIMAQALCECRQYQQALMFIENALLKNPENPGYITYKVKILNLWGKNKEALKYLDKYENSNIITPDYEEKFNLEKENVLASISGDENDKKFHQIRKYFIEGNYYKVINECRNILNFNKNNYKILTLQAQSFLMTGKDDLAKKGFRASYDINKNYVPTLIGLGDCAFLDNNPEDAAIYYKKALKINRENDLVKLKIAALCENFKDVKDSKTLAKLQKDIKSQNVSESKHLYYEYYIVSVTNFKNNPQKRRQYLLKSLSDNFLYKNSQDAYFAYLKENKKFRQMKNLLDVVAFINGFDYRYYYYRGASDLYLNDLVSAQENASHALSLNPDFEPASALLLEIKGEGIRNGESVI